MARGARPAHEAGGIEQMMKGIEHGDQPDTRRWLVAFQVVVLEPDVRDADAHGEPSSPVERRGAVVHAEELDRRQAARQLTRDLARPASQVEDETEARACGSARSAKRRIVR